MLAPESHVIHQHAARDRVSPEAAMNFKDFVPGSIESRGKFLGIEFPQTTFESFDACVTAARDWVAQQGVEVINLETVVLPNIYEPTESGTTDTDLVASGEIRTHWYQFLRVWYR